MKDKHIVAWALVLGCVIVLAFQSFWVIKRQPHSPQPFMQQRNNRYQQYSGWQTKLNSNHHSSSSNNNNKVFSIPNNNGQHNIKAKQKGIVISGDTFYDEENLAPLRILSGEFHYFRTPRVYWRDRLEKMRLGGLNTVSLYVPWNMHEPVPGLFNFAGELDLGAVITEAAAAGLYVIVRPGPYICAEWEFGGLPAWLLARNIRIRTSDPEFLSAANGYLEKVLDIVRPLQRTQGGPVIAMQIENEYGSYGSDMTYMKILRQLFRENGIDCFLFDSNNRLAIRSETLDDVLRTVNFGAFVSSPEQILGDLKRITRRGPLFVTEFWDGWFDHWGEPRHTYDPQKVLSTLDKILQFGASVNL